MTPERIVPLLLDWFAQHARDLPWRRTNDPYGIWVSEIMLQQTQVRTVIPYWERWMAALPSITALAQATSAQIHKLWEGLGYYTRVRNLQKAARLIRKHHAGRFPQTFEEVLALPGIGRYTAGAVCSIAFNQPCPILDGNVIRVLSRVFGLTGNPRDPAVNARLWAIAEGLVRAADRGGWLFKKSKPRDSGAQIAAHFPGTNGFATPRCSHFNQSLMELGALVCTPRQPRCEQCPLADWCTARKEDRVEALPQLPARPRTTRRRFIAFVVRRKDQVFIRQRPAGAVNAHLWEFPNVEVENHDGAPGKAAHRLFGAVRPAPVMLATLNHSITRYRIRLEVFELRTSATLQLKAANGRWVHRRALERFAFTGAHKKILARL